MILMSGIRFFYVLSENQLAPFDIGIFWQILLKTTPDYMVCHPSIFNAQTRMKKIDAKDRKIWYIHQILVFFSILWLQKASFYPWIEHFHLGMGER
jgi:hypothetical protein